MSRKTLLCHLLSKTLEINKVSKVKTESVKNIDIRIEIYLICFINNTKEDENEKDDCFIFYSDGFY